MAVSTLVFQSYSHLFMNKDDTIESIGMRAHPIPFFEETVLNEIFDEAIYHFRSQRNVLELDGDFVVVGDLHGNLIDLLRIFQKYGNPLHTKYIFLGDYVDRGEYSLEVITFLFSAAASHPQSVFLLRGNHEFESVNKEYGFYDQLKKIFGSDTIYKKANEVFSYLPFAAVINHHCFLVHGGISQYMKSISDIRKIPRPYIDFSSTKTDLLLMDLLWSDPGKSIDLFGPSPRGKGHEYSIFAVEDFLKESSLHSMIRAHQCEPNGVSVHYDGIITTVFSSSGYREGNKNLGAVVLLKKNEAIHSEKNSGNKIYQPFTKQIPECFSPVPHVAREFAHFKKIPITVSLRVLKSGNVCSPALRFDLQTSSTSGRTSARDIKKSAIVNFARCKIHLRRRTEISVPVPIPTFAE